MNQNPGWPERTSAAATATNAVVRLKARALSVPLYSGVFEITLVVLEYREATQTGGVYVRSDRNFRVTRTNRKDKETETTASTGG